MALKLPHYRRVEDALGTEAKRAGGGSLAKLLPYACGVWPLLSLHSLYSSVVDSWVLAGTVVVVAAATPWVVAGTFSVGALVAYLGYLGKVYGPAKKLSKVNLSIQKVLAAADRIFEVMALRPETAGATGPAVRRW